jgi:nucleoside-diphosphate-sugar epimerase
MRAETLTRRKSGAGLRALVVGGTGPTGPHIVNGLLARGFDVTLFHRGTHESDDIPTCVEHIHGDPHFTETIESALRDREFDLVVAMYGRIRLLARHFRERTGRLIAVGGVAAYCGHFAPERLFPTGMAIPAPENEPVAQSEADGHFSWRVAETEREVLALHPEATIFRYPLVYGPHQVLPLEWSLVRRALDRRPFVILPNGGLPILTRGYASNLAHAVLCAVDQPDTATGQIYNCGDERQFTLGQLAQIIAESLDHRWEVLGLPAELAMPAWPFSSASEASWHRLVSIRKLQTELGYRDLVPANDAIAATARWYASRRDQLAPAIEERLGDPFDYDAEDRLASDWRKCREELLARHFRPCAVRRHAYAHPSAPGLGVDHRGR